MAIGTVNSRHGTLKMKDATGSPIEITLGVLASFSIDAIQEGFTEAVLISHRGDPVELIPGVRTPVTGSIGMKQQAPITDGSTKTPLDAVLKSGSFAAGSTQDPGALVWTTDIVWVVSRSVSGATVTTTHTLNNCRCTLGVAESMEGNDYTISFTAYGTDSVLPLVLS